MTISLIAPSLESMGLVLFGEDWPECFAQAWDMPLSQIHLWHEKPEAMPQTLEAKLRETCEARIGEIQLMMELLEAVGLDRTTPRSEAKHN